jgi:hypothetical protein
VACQVIQYIRDANNCNFNCKETNKSEHSNFNTGTAVTTNNTASLGEHASRSKERNATKARNVCHRPFNWRKSGSLVGLVFPSPVNFKRPNRENESGSGDDDHDGLKYARKKRKTPTTFLSRLNTQN